MKNRSLLLLIAVILVGLFALPNALSLFSGQHSFDKAGNGTICVKCHSDVYAELEASAYHTFTKGGTPELRCKVCHSVGNISANLIPLGNGTNGTSGVTVGLNLTTGNFTMPNGTNISYSGFHAAITVECVSCHIGVNFTNDAHKPFSDNSSTATWLRGANEICYGCHTKVNVQMGWIRKGGFNYTYDFMNSSGVFGFNNTNVTTNTNNTG